MRRAERMVIVSLLASLVGVVGWAMRSEQVRQPPSYTWSALSWYGDRSLPRVTIMTAIVTVQRDTFLGVCVGKRSALQLTEVSTNSPRPGRQHRNPDGSPPPSPPADPPKARETAVAELQRSLRNDIEKTDPDEVVALLSGSFASPDGTAAVTYPWRGFLGAAAFAGPTLTVAGLAGLMFGVWRWRRTLKRIASGSCAGCGSNRSLKKLDEPCPECGWRQAAASAVASG